MSSGASTDQERFGAAVRALRVERGISQEGLALEVGLHRTYIGSVERGERNISLANILRIARVVGTTGAELLRRAGL